MTPQRGDLARCSRGQLGLITCDHPQLVNYDDTSAGYAWVGVHVTNGPGHKIGDPWSSRSPDVICNVSRLLEEYEKQ